MDDLYWSFESDSNVTITLVLIEYNGVTYDFTLEESFDEPFSTTYFFDGENGYCVIPEGLHAPFRYDSKTETLRKDEDTPEYMMVFYRVE